MLFWSNIKKYVRFVALLQKFARVSVSKVNDAIKILRRFLEIFSARCPKTGNGLYVREIQKKVH